MKSVISFFVLALFFTSVSYADQYDDLRTYAELVPHSELDKEAFEYIANETNESLVGIKSHYTLALFEDFRSGRSWYILDGYYQLKSGKILFLDFQYNPKTKTWWPIENYRNYIPDLSKRYMLEADEICNPYKRHFVGFVMASLGTVKLDNIQKFFKEKYQRQPILLFNDGNLIIIDPTKSTHMSQSVIFTLEEPDLISKLSLTFGLNASTIRSGRETSTSEIKKTYVGSTQGCMN